MLSNKVFFHLFLTLVILLNGSLAVAEQPKNNHEIREWYNQQVAEIPSLNQQWLQAGESAAQRARKAYDIRHNARIKAREMMPNKIEVQLLQARDQEKYGNPNGPTFEYLVQKNRSGGMTEEEAYEAIVDSSKRTNKAYNQKYGVKNKTNE